MADRRALDLLVVPFHDWRKSVKEGFRTRDAHFIQHLQKNEAVNRIVVVNRPTTYSEAILARRPWKTNGDVIEESSEYRLVQVGEKCFVFDFLVRNFVNQLIQGKKWFFEAYGMAALHEGLNKSLQALRFEGDCLYSQNLFAAAFCERYVGIPCVFDVFDNLLRFPQYAGFYEQMMNSYRSYSKLALVWTTNSEANRKEFQGFKKDISLIRNGVDVERFRHKDNIPLDLKYVSRPIIGLGAKITHLIDDGLLNFLVDQNPDFSFVIVGQVLDKRKFRAIRKRNNLHYLGDKHYDVYPSYVAHFDVCILPYVTGAGEHGQDPIKIYEYMAAQKPVVTTKVNGIEELSQFVIVADDYEGFSASVREAVRNGSSGLQLPQAFTWDSRTNLLLDLIMKQLTQ